MYGNREKILDILHNRRGNLPKMRIKSIQVVQQRQVMHTVKMPWQEVACSGDCNLGMPCQACGSNGQYIGNVVVFKTCGQCADFGPIGCTTSIYEQKHGNANTPACEEFKRKV